jgi:hypothetical protein
MKKTEPAFQLSTSAKKSNTPVISLEKYISSKERSLFKVPTPKSKVEGKYQFYTAHIFTVKRNDPL